MARGRQVHLEFTSCPLESSKKGEEQRPRSHENTRPLGHTLGRVLAQPIPNCYRLYQKERAYFAISQSWIKKGEDFLEFGI